METTGIRFIKLLKILIKIGIMFLVMAGLILINKKYMSNADGREKNAQIMSLERVVTQNPIILDN
ncbi:MAG: hypothetical protein ACYSTS_07560 [Planctomycetota bacterium]|jgi:hypothetical protein